MNTDGTVVRCNIVTLVYLRKTHPKNIHKLKLNIKDLYQVY